MPEGILVQVGERAKHLEPKLGRVVGYQPQAGKEISIDGEPHLVLNTTQLIYDRPV